MTRLPLIETNRLILREISDKDLYDMYEYSQIPYVGMNAGWEPHDSLNHTKEVIRMFRKKPLYGQLGVFSIVLKATGKMIGTCELHNYLQNYRAELGYTLSPKYWNQGFATEASKALITWGFKDLHLKRIECNCFKENKASRRVCEKLKFTYEGLKKKGYQLYDNSLHDLECFGMTDDDFYRIISNNEWISYE